MPVFRRAPRPEYEIERLEERRRILARTTQEWLALLRELETNGDVDDARYGRYRRAYDEALVQEKRCELQLFNYRRGLVG